MAFFLPITSSIEIIHIVPVDKQYFIGKIKGRG